MAVFVLKALSLFIFVISIRGLDVSTVKWVPSFERSIALLVIFDCYPSFKSIILYLHTSLSHSCSLIALFFSRTARLRIQVSIQSIFLSSNSLNTLRAYSDRNSLRRDVSFFKNSVSSTFSFIFLYWLRYLRRWLTLSSRIFINYLGSSVFQFSLLSDAPLVYLFYFPSALSLILKYIFALRKPFKSTNSYSIFLYFVQLRLCSSRRNDLPLSSSSKLLFFCYSKLVFQDLIASSCFSWANSFLHQVSSSSICATLVFSSQFQLLIIELSSQNSCFSSQFLASSFLSSRTALSSSNCFLHPLTFFRFISVLMISSQSNISVFDCSSSKC